VKKSISVVAISFLLCVFFSACSAKTHTKDIVQIRPLSTNDKEVLQALNLQDRANVISFQGPKEAKGIEVHTYVLGKDNTWEENGHGESWCDENDDSLLEGTFSMLLNENYSIEYHIDTGGEASYQTDQIVLDKENLISAHTFLEQSKEFNLNEPIPVAIIAYDSGNSMRVFSLEDYFDPERFKGMVLVQAVVLEFTDDVN
jgi:hypothetical protein